MAVNKFDKNSMLQARKAELLAQLLLDSLEGGGTAPRPGEVIDTLYRIKDLTRMTWQQIGRNDPKAVDDTWDIRLPKSYISDGLMEAAKKLNQL